MNALVPILASVFNAAVEEGPSILTFIDAVRNHPTTSPAVKAQLDDLAARIAADETEADNLPPLPDVPTPAPAAK